MGGCLVFFDCTSAVTTGDVIREIRFGTLVSIFVVPLLGSKGRNTSILKTDMSIQTSWVQTQEEVEREYGSTDMGRFCKYPQDRY